MRSVIPGACATPNFTYLSRGPFTEMDENGEPFTFDLNLSIATTDLPQKEFGIFCNLFEGRFKYQLASRSHTSI